MYAVIVTHAKGTTLFGPFSMAHKGKPNVHDFMGDARRKGYEVERVLMHSHKALDSFAESVPPPKKEVAAG